MVADDARAEAQSRYQGDWDPYHDEPVDDFGFSGAERRAFIAGAEWAAARAETTTELYPCLPSLGEPCGNCHRCTDPAETTTATAEDH